MTLTDHFGNDKVHYEVTTLRAMCRRTLPHLHLRLLTALAVATAVVSAGSIVPFAGHAPIVSSEGIVIGRAGPIYTPHEQCNHGFAITVTAMVSQHLVDRGA